MLRLPRIRRPPHCPNPDCRFHLDSTGWRYKRKGFYHRQTAPRTIQRYVCLHCHRNFSSQTFHVSYWLRHTELFRRLFFRLTTGSCLRQISREFGVAHTTVMRQANRLGRHCLLLHERLRPEVPPELLVLDGFRSLESGHYWPFDANLLVGSSLYVYGFNDAELRRSGTMRPGQRRHRERLETRHGRPSPRATEDAVVELVRRVVPHRWSGMLWSDEHQAYPRALRRVGIRALRHQTISSKAARTAKNPLFPVNLTDLLLRHDSANHKRETIAFSKRRQGAMYRLAIWSVWRNYLKSTSENRNGPTPGERIGVIERRLTLRDVLKARLFETRRPLEGWLRRCYRGEIPTRRLPVIRPHRSRFAF